MLRKLWILFSYSLPAAQLWFPQKWRKRTFFRIFSHSLCEKENCAKLRKYQNFLENFAFIVSQKCSQFFSKLTHILFYFFSQNSASFLEKVCKIRKFWFLGNPMSQQFEVFIEDLFLKGNHVNLWSNDKYKYPHEICI